MEIGTTLDVKTTAVRNAASKFPGYQALTVAPVAITVEGQPAREFESLIPQDGKSYHVLTVTAARDRELYTFNLIIAEAEYQANIDQARTLLNTFVFLK